MPSHESDLNARLDNRLKRWEKDHLQGETRVVIKYGKRRGGETVPLNEFGSTRLTFQYGANDLETLLLAYLRATLEHLTTDVGQLGMPAQEAGVEYESRAERASKEYFDRFRGAIADLRSAMKQQWDDEYERQFSEDEIEACICPTSSSGFLQPYCLGASIWNIRKASSLGRKQT